MAERTRIAREMHDVLAHRISLMALHAGALEIRPDLPPAEVRQTAELLRLTARQALEELRSVIGVLRDEPGSGGGGQRLPSRPCPTSLGWWKRLGGRAPRSTSRCGSVAPTQPRAHWDATPIGSSRKRSPTSASTQSARRPRCESPAHPTWACGSASATASRSTPMAGPALPGLRRRPAGPAGTGRPGRRHPHARARTAPATSSWTPSCHGPGESAAGRRRRPRARRTTDDPVLGRRPRGRRRGGRRRPRRGRGARAPTRRRTDGHPDGRDGRHHGHRRAAPSRPRRRR